MRSNNFHRTLGIYVHIPFCVQKCKYCDFCSSAGFSEATKSEYCQALIKDIKDNAKSFSEYLVDSVFFGGGTPTCLSPDALGVILEVIYSSYNVSLDAEITLECNPATAEKRDFEKLLKYGFNRLSIGLQSVHDDELNALGRIHSFDEFEKTYRDAREAGFKNVNLDLMYGIPLQSLSSFESTLQKVIDLSPEHISAYALKVEQGTEFYRKRNELLLPDEDTEYEMYSLADRMLSRSGYKHYEISNYAKSGKESRHNLKYWSLDDYVGFGVAAHSLIEGVRYAVTDSVKEYVSSVNGERDAYHFQIEEELSHKAAVEEYIMMRLRLADGLAPTDFKTKFGVLLDEKYIERIERFVKSGHVEVKDGAYAFNKDGMYVSNYILSEILDL